MTRAKILRMLVAACAACLLAASLSACSQQLSQTGTTAAEANSNSEYMSQVNQKMDDLTTRLESFSDAVSRGDVVTMRTQADNAFKVIDEISKLDVPDGLKTVSEDYVNGCTKLKEALDGYVTLYTEISSATDSDPFDYSTYESRIEAIQSAYDEGISLLQAGDEDAGKKD